MFSVKHLDQCFCLELVGFWKTQSFAKLGVMVIMDAYNVRFELNKCQRLRGILSDALRIIIRFIEFAVACNLV